MVRKFQLPEGPGQALPGLPPARNQWRYWLDLTLDRLWQLGAPRSPPADPFAPPPPHPKEKPGYEREILWLRVALTLVAAVVLLAAAAWWRNRQLHLTRDRLIAQADAQAAAGEGAAAIQGYRAAWALFPDRSDVLWKLTETYDRGAVTPSQKRQSLDYYRRVASLDVQHRRAARERMAELLWDLGAGLESLSLAEAVLDEAPHSPRAWRVKGLALAHRHDAQADAAPEELIAALDTAYKLNPDDLPLAAGLAGWLRRAPGEASPQEAAQRADAVMDQYLERHPNDPQAHLARFAYRSYFDLPGADDDLETALRLAPEHGEVTLAAGQQFRSQKNWTAARKLYARLVELKPGDARGHLGLALSYAGQRDLPRAVQAAQRGIEASPQDPWLIVQACGWSHDLGDPAAAARLLERLQSQWGRTRELLPPHQIAALEQARELLEIRGDMAANKLNSAVDRLRALAAYHESRDILPEAMSRRLQVHTLLVLCMEKQLDWYGAAEQRDALARLEPNSADRWATAGRAWLKARQPGRAIQRLERALTVDPGLDDVRAELKSLRASAPK